MSLLSRLTGIPEPGQNIDQVDRIGFMQLVSAMAERKRGHISAETIASRFNLSGADLTQAVSLYNKLDALTNNAQREAFLSELNQVLSCAEARIDDSANGGINYGDLASLQTRISAL